MKNKIQILSFVSKGILTAVSFAGLYDIVAAGEWYSFNYFTILSNLAVFIYFMISFAHGAAPWRPRLQGVVTFAITVTFLIYTFLLAPDDLAAGAFWTSHNIIVHYIVPIMAIADWLVFAPRKKLKSSDPLLRMTIPVAYFAYIIIRAQFITTFGPKPSPYPYGFIDVYAHGWHAVAMNSAFVIMGMLALAYIFYWADHSLNPRRS